MKVFRIIIFEKIGSSAAVASNDGERLFKIISSAFEKNLSIVLDFNNIELITSTFLNAAIGQLYDKYDSPFINKHLKVENMAPEDKMILKKVVIRAKEYFKDRAKMENSLKEAMGDE